MRENRCMRNNDHGQNEEIQFKWETEIIYIFICKILNSWAAAIFFRKLFFSNFLKVITKSRKNTHKITEEINFSFAMKSFSTDGRDIFFFRFAFFPIFVLTTATTKTTKKFYFFRVWKLVSGLIFAKVHSNGL